MGKGKRLFKKDYKAKKYQNPFFLERKKKKQFFSYLGYLIRNLLFFLAFLTLIWLFFYSSYFQITKIQISGQNSLIDKDINNLIIDAFKAKKFLILPQKNIFLFNANPIKKELAESYFFSQLKITKKYPHTLIIAYQQQEPFFIWLENGQYYYLDKQGHVLTKAKQGKEKKMFLVENTGDSKIKGKVLKLATEKIFFLTNFITALNNYQPISSFAVDRLRIDSSPYTVTLVLKAGPLIYFSTRLDAQMQLKKLSLVIKEKIKNDFSKKKYIDLRYGDMVYLK